MSQIEIANIDERIAGRHAEPYRPLREGRAPKQGASSAVLSIRKADARDLNFIVNLVPRLADRNFSPAYYTTAQLIDGTTCALRSALERSSDEELFVIASGEGRDVGFLWANAKADYFTGEAHGYIEEVAVAQDGIGVGSALIEYAETWARTRGYRYISLSVRPANMRAKDLYSRRGYCVDTEVRLKLL